MIVGGPERQRDDIFERVSSELWGWWSVVSPEIRRSVGLGGAKYG